MPAYPPWSKAWIRGCTSRQWASCDTGGRLVFCVSDPIQFKMVSVHSEKPHLAETVPMLPLKQFQCLSHWWRPFQNSWVILQTISVHSQTHSEQGVLKQNSSGFHFDLFVLSGRKSLSRLVPLTVWLFCPQSFPFCCRNCNQQPQSHWTSFQCLKMFF